MPISDAEQMIWKALNAKNEEREQLLRTNSELCNQGSELRETLASVEHDRQRECERNRRLRYSSMFVAVGCLVGGFVLGLIWCGL